MGSGFKLVLLATVCSIALALAAGSAAASTYCVGTGTCIGGTPEPSIQVAFDAAGTHAGADTVLIGTLGSPYVGDFNYGYASDPVSVIGVGDVKPVIQASPGGIYAMRVDATTAALVQNLSFVVPNENGGTGLAWSGIADGISVTHTGTGKEIHALFPYGDTLLENSQIKIEGGGFGDGISLQFAAAGFTMRDSTLTGTTRVGLNTVVAAPNVILQRVAITAFTTALQLSGSGSSVTAQQLFVKATPSTSTGDVISLLAGTTLDATHATIVANGIGRGILVSGNGTDSTATITNSIIANVGISGLAAGSGASGTLNLTHSLIATPPTVISGGAANVVPGVIIGAPTFVDAGAGDYHLKAPQAAIDSGDPGDTTTIDLSGKPRIVDGDGTGGARSDVGAFEYQRSIPVPWIASSPTKKQNEPAAFDGSQSKDGDPGDTLTYAWSFGDGSTGSGVSAVHAFATAGVKTVSLTVTDQLGLSASKTAQITVTDGIAPKFTIGKPKPNRKGTTVTYKLGCPKTETRCTISAAITAANGKKKARALAKAAKVVVKGGASKTLTLRLNKTTLKLIASKHKLKTKVRFVGTDDAGNSKTVTQRYTAKQGKSGSAINKK